MSAARPAPRAPAGWYTADQPAAWLQYGLIAIILVFPSTVAAEFIKLFGIPGRAFDWAIMGALVGAVALWLRTGARVRSRTVALIALGIATWAAFLLTYSAGLTRNSTLYVVAGGVPYMFWMCLLIPALLGAVPSWRVLSRVMIGATLVAAAIGGYALFFDRTLLAYMLQPEAGSIEDYLALSFRLPAGKQYLAPLFILWLVVEWRSSTRRTLRGFLGRLALILLLVLIVVANQNRTTLLVMVLALAFLTRKTWTGRLVASPGYVAVALGLLVGGFLLLGQVDDRLAQRIQSRFVEGFADPMGTLEGAYEGNRDVLYQHSVETAERYPVLGRGLGTTFQSAGGRTISMQDVSILNHLDKSGMTGVLLFVLLHAFLYWRMRGAVRTFRRVMGRGPEYEIRRMFVRYYPFLLLTSLNIDILYKDPFVAVHAILVGGLLVEAEGLRRGAGPSPLGGTEPAAVAEAVPS